MYSHSHFRRPNTISSTARADTPPISPNRFRFRSSLSNPRNVCVGLLYMNDGTEPWPCTPDGFWVAVHNALPIPCPRVQCGISVLDRPCSTHSAYTSSATVTVFPDQYS